MYCAGEEAESGGSSGEASHHEDELFSEPSRSMADLIHSIQGELGQGKKSDNQIELDSSGSGTLSWGGS